MMHPAEADTTTGGRFPVFKNPRAIQSLLGRFLPLFVLAGTMILTAAAYGPTQGYSLLFDDALDLTRAENRTYWQILSEPFPGFGYYRPVPYLIFKASYDVTGEHHSGLIRSLILLVHAMSGWLLYLLVRRLTGSNWAIAASALFILFPFSYQTISVIGAIGHVLVTLSLLTMLLLWYEGRKRGSPSFLIGAIVFGVLSVWTVEYGVLALPLLVGLELLLRYQRGFRTNQYPHLAVLAAAHALYVTLWFTMDKPASETVTLEDITRNSVVWLQAAAYPASRFLNVLSNGSDVPAYRTVALVSAVFLAGGLVVHSVLRQIWIGLISLAVAGVTFLPSMLMLSHEYVLSGPRLFYVAAPAIATFWALLGQATFGNRRLTTIWKIAIAAVLAVTLLHSHSFVERRVDMFGTAHDVVQSVVDVADANSDSNLLLLNTPSWFAFHSTADQEYPVGHLGAQAIPVYLGLDGLYYAITGRSASIDSASLAPDVTGWTFAFGPHGPFVDHDEIDARMRSGQELHIFRLDEGGPAVHQPGRLHTGVEAGDPGLATFGNKVTLTDLEWRVRDRTLHIDAEWYSLAPLEADYQIRTEALDGDGAVVLGHQDYALGGMSPPRLWQPGDEVSDYLWIEHAGETAIEEVRVSLVSTDDNAALEISDSSVDTHGGVQVGFPSP